MKLTPAQQELAASHVGFARTQARVYARRSGVRVDECESAALLGLCQAAARFDPACGVKFAAFALPRVRGAIIDAARMDMPQGFRRGGRASAEGCTEEPPEFVTLSPDAPLAADECPVGWELESEDEVRGAARRLACPKQRRVVLALYAHCETQTQAAVRRNLGLSQAYVSQLHSWAVRALREELGGAA